jgi:hypothetical protein
MMHLTDGQLRAHLDGETDSETAAHLDTCPACRSRLEAVTARSARVTASLNWLSPPQNDSPQAVLSRFKDKQRKENSSMIQKLFSRKYRPAWTAAAVVAALAVAFSFPQVQALAANFLGLFRVKQIEVVQIDPSRLSEINDDKALGERMGQMFSDSFTVTKQAGAPQTVASAEEASALAGFAVRLPENQTGAPLLTVQDSSAFEFKVNRELAQGILTDSGFADVTLPVSLDNEPIKVEIPASVTATYGNCPGPDTAQAEHESPDWNQLHSCLMVAQVPSPTVTAPDDLDIAQLAEAGLQFVGMSASEARRFSQSVDWATTLVIPIPNDAATVTDVQVDGVTGTLIRSYPDEGARSRYTLLWVKGEIIYAVSGFGSSGEAVGIANSMK